MKSIPLFYFPTTIIWVDDDKLLLDAVTHVFSEDHLIKPFSSPKECLAFLDTYQSSLSKKSFIKGITDDESYGVLKHTPTDFDITTLVNLMHDEHRSQEITTMVIDYNMPEMDGFTLAKACQHLPIKKVLLTGKANEGDAVAAFNNNLIHRFIQKGEMDMDEKISDYLQELNLEYFQRLTASLLCHLETQNKLPLTDPAFIRFFEQLCQQQAVIEYYLIDKQGSFLLKDKKGQKFCLILQSDEHLEQWLAQYGQELPQCER